MKFPTVRVRRYSRGWFTTCSACWWTIRRPTRPDVDTLAIDHHTAHAQEGAR